ncbi:MAG: cytochrome c [Holophagales bacterium]|nr:cytochrome c [Holophagales bacterium]MYA08562.1 cytochrome c [Holophagales bacterium]MYC09083.1 cytochrome c [Holophagales bacterium]MYG32097.1 cytochrome c [Holophagales bacterium]MYI80521.1 cytochrome c [Holophagales bacterium]
MPRRSWRPTFALLFVSGVVFAAESERTGLGSEPTAEELGAAGYTVFPDGKGLPAGSGTVSEGRAVYQQFCAACHGRNAEGDEAAALVGGRDSLTSGRPRKTVESYWPYATTLWDYIRRSMPYESPGSLNDDEIYAVVAHLLHLGGVVGEDAVLDQESLPRVEMPNREGFVSDDRPDTD